MQKTLFGILCTFCLALWGGFLFVYYSNAQSATVQATVQITVCGNNVKETGEECDGTDLAGESCATQGFTSGTLACKPSCDFDTSSCTTDSGGGGGGSVGGPTPSPAPSPLPTQINFTGQANPGDLVVLLKDAQRAATAVAGPDGVFSITLTGLSAGNYIFSLYLENAAGGRSALLAFPVNIASNTITNVRGISFEPAPPGEEQPSCADPNNDGRVDLVDFSILLFWFARPDVPSHIDCNGDGGANLVDFSIMAYYWTG